jgi:hypothetical protein
MHICSDGISIAFLLCGNMTFNIYAGTNVWFTCLKCQSMYVLQNAGNIHVCTDVFYQSGVNIRYVEC